ncbi:MAG: HU family DNA-binding protein [Patescibacteria group bacterium]|jgi:nucleoid DNA-binding protein|nr:HU family DNA-binding protein [Patescibacteria group bacterium]
MPAKKFINPKDLAEILAEKKDLKINKKQAEEIIKSLANLIIKKLQENQTVKITGFGTFSTKNRHARAGVNPQKPEERIKIPAVRVIKFKAGKRLKDALKK